MNDLYPISGYVSFAEGTRREDIVIATVDDEEEEADEIFTVKILSAKGARLADEGTTATLTGQWVRHRDDDDGHRLIIY